MIKVEGILTLKGNFSVELDMSEEEFDSLPKWQQEDEIGNMIDWRNWTESADMSDLDIDDINESEDEQ